MKSIKFLTRWTTGLIRRTSEFCEQLKSDGHQNDISSKTGLVIDAYFSGTKLKWILDNIEGAREKATNGELAFGTVDSWLIWNLTKGEQHVTDVSNASRTMLFNLSTLNWDHEMLELMDIPESVLPKIVDSSINVGSTAKDLFGKALPISGIAGDQQAALFGQLCTKPGMVKNTYGTGCFILTNTGDKIPKSSNNLLSTVAWKIGDQVNYALEGSVFIGGAVVQWLRDQLEFIDAAPDVLSMASQVENNGGVYLVPAFVGLGAPHWDSNARGALFGLTRGSSKAHIARAAHECIAFQSAEVIEAMSRDASIDISEMRVDGGASTNDLLMQIQSDASQLSVLRPRIQETTALGAAYLAGLAMDLWDMDDLSSRWEIDQRFDPKKSMEQERNYWDKAVARTKNWLD